MHTKSLALTALSWIKWRNTMAADSIVEMPGCGAQETPTIAWECTTGVQHIQKPIMDIDLMEIAL